MERVHLEMKRGLKVQVDDNENDNKIGGGFVVDEE